MVIARQPIALLLLLFAASSSAVPTDPIRRGGRENGSDWPRFLGPGGDGKSTEVGVALPWPDGGPRLVWGIALGEGYGAPSVAQGRLFHFERYGDQARLSCRRSATGDLLWQRAYAMDYEDYYGYSDGPRASPVIDEDRVYTFGVEGRLRCHRVTDGELLWDVDTQRDFGVVQNFFGVGSTPVVEGDLLIAVVGGSPPGSPRIHSGQVTGDGSALVAFDKRTGEVRYRTGDELASYASPVLATIGGRRWGFAFLRGGLVGFEPGSGRIDFHYPWRSSTLESVNAASPVVVGDTVFVSESYGPGGSLLRVRPGGYDVVWKDPPGRQKSLATHWSTPIHHEGFLYGSSGQATSEAELRCVEHSTGVVRWSEPGLTRSTLLFADGLLVVLGEYGVLRLVAADPARYRLLAEADLRGRVEILPTADGDQRRLPLLSYPAWNAPVLSHGLLYLRGAETLIALELIPTPE